MTVRPSGTRRSRSTSTSAARDRLEQHRLDKPDQVRVGEAIMGTLLEAENPAKSSSRELARIVHDFNNLLGVVLNFSILAREKLVAGGPSAGEQVQQAVRHLERVENAAREAIKLNKELSAQIPGQERPPQP